MNAAKRLFLEQGVRPKPIEQITSRAEVAKRSFSSAVCIALWTTRI